MHFSKTLTRAAFTLSALVLSVGAQAAITYNANVTNAAIYGSGNTNGGFTIDTANNVELGLRGHVRYPSPQNQFNSNGDGTYTFAAGGFTGLGAPGGTRASWNFDFSINSDQSGAGGRNLSALRYELGFDFNPGATATFDLLDPMIIPDSSYGNNSTAQGAGVEPGGGATSASLQASNNLAQNSENFDFFNEFFGRTFDPNANATYNVYLAAFDGAVQLARTDIQIIVGTGAPQAVPEPASLALVCLALAGLGMSRKLRRD